MLSTNEVLSVENLSVKFNNNNLSFDAVQNISFQVAKGKTLAVIGQSGSGKSVTALALMGLLPKNAQVSGKISLNQQLVENWNSIRGKDIGMVFQEPMSALNPIRTCGDQLLESILTHQKVSKKKAKEMAISWMLKVRLPNPQELYKRYPHQISGGQKQRIMIAMAICNYPSLLIADEPTTALDVTVQKEIINLMKQLQAELGLSIIFITHDLDLAKHIASDYIVMESGKIINNSQPISLFNNRDSDEQEKKHSLKLLEVVHVDITYPGRTGWFNSKKNPFKAVDNVSFIIHSGETVGLVGESGCGKSTLSKGILGLQNISSGEILFKDRNLSNLNKNEWKKLRKNIQIIYQDPYSSLNPRLTIEDALTEPLIVHNICNKKEARLRVLDTLNKVEMPMGSLHKYPHEFSGGQRQRICIARTLVLSPELIICDESVSALDIKIQAQVLQLLINLQQELGLAYLFITHDLKVVKSISNRILVMQNGSIVEQGYSEDVMTNPKSSYTKKLIEAIP